MSTAVLQIVRICLVIALVCVAAALATPKGRLPLALRGLAKLMQRDRGQPSAALEGGREPSVSAGKRALAFFLVIIAILLALI